MLVMPLGGEHLAADDDRRVNVVLDRFLDGDFAGCDRGDGVGAGRCDVHAAEAAGGGLAEGDRAVLAAVDLLAVLGLAHPLDQFAHGEVERDVLLGAPASARTSGSGPTTVSST